MVTENCTTCKEFPAIYYCTENESIQYQGACHFLDHIEACALKHLPYVIETVKETPQEPNPESPIEDETLQEAENLEEEIIPDEEQIEEFQGEFEEVFHRFDEFSTRINDALKNCMDEERQKLEQIARSVEAGDGLDEATQQKIQQMDVSNFMSHFDEIFTKSEIQIVQALKFNIKFLDPNLAQKKPPAKIAEELKSEIQDYKQTVSQLSEQIQMLGNELQAKEDQLYIYKAAKYERASSPYGVSSSLNSSLRCGTPDFLFPRSPKLPNLSYKQTFIMQKHRSTVYCVLITSDKKYVISASSDKTIRVWNIKKAELEVVFTDHTKPVRSIAITQDNKYIISASFDKTVRIFNLWDKVQVSILEGHTHEVNCAILTHDDKYIISSSNDATTLIWNFEALTFTSIIHEYSKILCLAVSRDDKYLFSGSYDHKITVWNLAEISEEATMIGHSGCIFSIVVNHANTHLYSASEDHSIRIWRIDEWNPEGVLQGHSECVWSLDIDGSDRYLVSGSYDKTVRVWDVFEKNQESVLQGHSGSVFCVAVTEDCKYIISGSSDKTVKAWSLDE